MCKLLIVDDEKIERDGVKFFLEKLNLEFEVHDEPNGSRALEYIEKVNGVDILLTDVEMPFMDGIELSNKARGWNADLKTIIFSAYSEFEYARRAIDARVCGYLLKPLKLKEFEGIMTKTRQLWEKDRRSLEAPKTLKGPGASSDSHQRKLIRTVLSIIEEEYASNIGLDYIAQKVYLTPSYLSMLFKKEMNTGLVHYINDYRLERAKEMLLNTNMRVIDISGKVGYESLAYFYSIFKKKYGKTPAEYREG